MIGNEKVKTDIGSVFSNLSKGQYVKVSAPMVRYSKLPYRCLLRRYNVDLCFTPMVLADSFCQSSYARKSEFTTSSHDSPVIAQFAANTVRDFVGATKLIYNYVDGVDLNCGCPQRWAIKDGYGCGLLANPQKIFELVRECSNAVSENFSISVKLRILNDSKESVDLCRQIEKCGVTFITVHGRTPSQKSSENVNTGILKDIVSSVQIPVIANGGVKTLSDADDLYNQTLCRGVMVANGMLTNPGLFTGLDKTSQSCIQDWYNIKNRFKGEMVFQTYHHHFVFMLEKVLSKNEKQIFNYLSTFEDVDAFLVKYFDVVEDITYDNETPIDCYYSEELSNSFLRKKCLICDLKKCCCKIYDYSLSDGKYFESMCKISPCDLDLNDCNLFEE